MQDTISCPICGDKMRVVRTKNKFLTIVNKTADYCERTCIGTNHSVQFFTDEQTKQVDFLKLSLEPDYTKFIQIDFFNKKCTIHCFKDSKPQIIEVPRVIVPDFPDLKKLKNKVSVLITFS
jgi:hypothetical protein